MLLLVLQVLGLAVLISLLIRVLFGGSKDPSNLATASATTENFVGDAGQSSESISATAPPLSSQNPWRANTDWQKGGNNSSGRGGGDENKDVDNDTDGNVENENDKNEAYIPAHLSELLVKDGVPKQAPGPQSF